MSKVNTVEAAMRLISEATKETLPSQQVRCLLCVMSKGEYPLEELGRAVGVGQTSCVRAVQALGTADGFGLLSTAPDPDYPRRYIVQLTTKGKALRAKIEAIA